MIRKVAVIMGSDSDWPVVKGACAQLKALDIPFEAHILSAHRTPAEAAALAEEYLDMNAAVVETAIPNMGLTFKSAQDAREELDTFYQLLNDFDPSMIGGALPDDGLYYAG